MDMASIIFADLYIAHCVCLYKNECHQHFGQLHCYEMHTATRPTNIYNVCLQSSGWQPVSWATLCVDTTVKQQHIPMNGEVTVRWTHTNTK